MNTSIDAARWPRMMSVLADALERPASERQAFIDEQAGDDTELRARLIALVAAASADDTPLDHPPGEVALEALEHYAGPQWVGRSLGPYKLLALIGAGGMGQVYLAERVDGHYEQRVAVKLMREGLDRAALVSRFKAERQLLARLDHPNLAKLLDGGITADGIPYFVMELISGEPIDAYCETQGLALEQRLRLFRTVCQVVHYAHQRGVIHRDLKPANILVTREGVVKLVDFGIAKQVAAPADTATIGHAMTLEYASPEQVRGDAVTLASDIYALGVVLYRLLCGAGPYPVGANDYELAKAICDTEPPPPSTRADRAKRRPLRGDLDAVVMMALRKEPARRHESAEQFGDDLFRHLEGLPVQARRDTLFYRTGRLMLRHRNVLAATMLMLVAGIAVSSYQAYEASVQRQRAERHSTSIRQLANLFIFDIHDAIRDLPGATAARDLLTRTALTYLEQLSSESTGDPALQLELGTGYRKVGDLQGLASGANIGKPDDALRSYDRGIALLHPLLTADVAAATRNLAQRELTALHQHKAGVLGSRGRYDEADKALDAGLAVAETLNKEEPGVTTHELVLAQMHGQRSLVRFMTGQAQGYLQSAGRSAGLLEAILAREPEHRGAAMNLAIHHVNRGEYFMQREATRDSTQLALDDFTRAQALFERLRGANPHDAHVLRDLAIAVDNIGWALLRLGRTADAAARHRQALELFDTLAAKDAADASHGIGRARALGNLGGAELELGRTDDAVQHLQTALAAYERLPSGLREETDARYSHAQTLFRLGRALEARAGAATDTRKGQAELLQARERYRASLPILVEVHKLRGEAARSLLQPGEVSAALERVEATLARR